MIPRRIPIARIGCDFAVKLVSGPRLLTREGKPHVISADFALNGGLDWDVIGRSVHDLTEVERIVNIGCGISLTHKPTYVCSKVFNNITCKPVVGGIVAI